MYQYAAECYQHIDEKKILFCLTILSLVELAKIPVESLMEGVGWLLKTCDLLYSCNIYFYHSSLND